MKRGISGLLIVGLVFSTIFLYYLIQQEPSFPKSGKEEIRGLSWSTISYYYSPTIYGEVYNRKSNARLISKAKNAGANYLLIRAFYNGTKEGDLVGSETEAMPRLKEAIAMTHDNEMKILLIPYVESREYWETKQWTLSEDVWTSTVLKWARFAEENDVEMFAPGIEMNLILDENVSGEWVKGILPRIRGVYHGRVITAEHYDIERWKILDESGSFAGYDCIGLSLFPRKEYDGVSDIRSFEDYMTYVEEEARTMDMLSEKYNIQCKLAVPMGLDYWKGSYPEMSHPNATVIAQATDLGLDILEKHNFTGAFIMHWASEIDDFGENDKDVEMMLRRRWTKAE